MIESSVLKCFSAIQHGAYMSADDTKNKILDVAEKLFAENGLQATSLRQIINEAGVNVASVHYHFGSKNVIIEHAAGVGSVKKAGE